MEVKTQKIIVSYDTAIDHVRASRPDANGKIPLDEYVATRDLAIIQPFIIPAELPTYFNIHPLSYELADRIASINVNEYYNCKLCFQHGVSSVENHTDRDGTHYHLWKPSGIVNNEYYITDDEIKLFAPYQRAEIGMVIFQLSFLEHKTFNRLQLPLGSRERLAAIRAQ